MDLRYKLEDEIKILEATNAQLGGAIHSIDSVCAGNSELTARRDELKSDNERLISELRGLKTVPPVRGNVKHLSPSIGKRKRK